MKTLTILLISILILGACETNEPKNSTKDDVLEEEIFKQTNEHRSGMGMNLLSICEACDMEALTHSQNMAQGTIAFGHDGFQLRFDQIVIETGAISGAENIARGFSSAEAVVQGWLDSPGHKENIEGNYSHMGLGIAESVDGEKFYTQIFVRIP